MPIKTYKPVTKGRRFMTTLVRENISKKRPERGLTEFIGKSGGRNNLGRLTSYHRGGGHKQLYRVIDFKRDKDGVKAQVTAIEYDPNRSANIALVQYADGEKRYILAPQGMQVGQSVENGPGAEIAAGNCLPLKQIPLGTFVHNIEMKPGKGGQLARSAGVGSQLMARQDRYAYITMPSGELRLVNEECRATIGMVGNADHSNVTIGKAGRSRWLGKRSRVRAICRNPVDHPMGGGEGRSKSNKHPQSMWGVLAKGKKTRKPGPSDKFIVSRRKSKRKA